MKKIFIAPLFFLLLASFFSGCICTTGPTSQGYRLNSFSLFFLYFFKQRLTF
jgi:hypothetical protein